MRNPSLLIRALAAAVLVLTTSATRALADGETDDGTADGTAEVTAIHGIAGLPEPVDVYIDGDFAFSFDFGEDYGPVDLPAGTIMLEVWLQGQPVLTETATLEPGRNYTVIAHETYIDGTDSGIKLSVFENRVRRLRPNEAWVTVRHTADAPPVDIELGRGRSRNQRVTFEDLSNNDDEMPQGAGPVKLRPGNYRVRVFPAGGRDAVARTRLGPLRGRRIYIVHAIGSVSRPDPSFTFFVQEIRAN
ncbi:MAG: DUF4397 domain-containing protein [Planctomycetota bacterium]|jgi:hypothetical protein